MSRVRRDFRQTSPFKPLVMLALLAGGIGLTARGLRPRGGPVTTEGTGPKG